MNLSRGVSRLKNLTFPFVRAFIWWWYFVRPLKYKRVAVETDALGSVPVRRDEDDHES